MSTAWSHLPNAQHIDRVLASLNAHPKEWTAAQYVAETAARIAAYGAAYGEACDMARDMAYEEAANAASVASAPAFDAACDAITALLAYDDCAHYLDMTSDRLRVWATLSENPAAILLLPAVIAFEKIQLLKNQN